MNDRVNVVEKNDEEQKFTNEKDVEMNPEKERFVNETKLYVEIRPDQWPIVFHPDYYDISFFGLEKMHPFDAGKWGKIFKFLKAEGMLNERTIVKPKEVSESDLLVVHTKCYLCSLKFSMVVAGIMEVPCVACLPNFLVQRYALKKFRYHTGGTILAAKLALERGWAINLGGGFHHCSANSGGGFCAYADITLAITFLFVKRLIRTAMIIDLDAHQGNGHERDFTGENRVYILDMYNASIYPRDGLAKRGISRNVPLNSFTDDARYLEILRRQVRLALDEFQADLIVYNAGTDCLINDPLGCLSITAEGIQRRDEIVFTLAKEHSVPIVMVTSGGYQRNNAQIIANSILNLRNKNLISLEPV